MLVNNFDIVSKVGKKENVTFREVLHIPNLHKSVRQALEGIYKEQ